MKLMIKKKMLSNKLTLGLILFSACLILPTIGHAQVVEEGHYVSDIDGSSFNKLSKEKEVVIDHRTNLGFEAYGPKGIHKLLDKLNVLYIPLSELEQGQNKIDYPSYSQIEKKLKDITQRYPSIMTLFSIGKTIEGRELWVVKISDNPNADELEPEFKYIANMHGNEIVGRELMVKLIEDIGKSYTENNNQTKFLVQNTEIFIMPSLNPDGAEKKQRGNSRFVDLNRNFPDFSTSDNQNTPNGRQPETQAVMKFQLERNFSLSANFHGGAVVFNYPWDTIAGKHPLHDHVVNLALEYADKVPAMRNSQEFPKGIVNGYAWYEVDGGMQDWSYNWHSDLQNTIELSDNKWPSYDEVETFYKDNKDSLFSYISKSHQGFGLTFLNSPGPIKVQVRKVGLNQPLAEYLTNKVEWFKNIADGEYEISAESAGKKVTKTIVVSFNNLLPATYYPISF